MHSTPASAGLLCVAFAGLLAPADGNSNTLGRNRGPLLSACFCYNETLNEVCEGANDHCMTYIKEVATETWMVVLGLVALFSLCFWRCARNCCHTCGSSKMSNGVCGGKGKRNKKEDTKGDGSVSDSKGDSDDGSNRSTSVVTDDTDDEEDEFTGYSRRQQRGFRIGLVLCFVVSAALIPVGLGFNETFSEGVAEIGASLDQWMDNIVRVVATVNYEFGRLPESVAPEELRQSINESTAAAVDALKRVREGKDSVMDYDHGEGYSRKKLTIISGALLFAGACFAALMGLGAAYRYRIPCCVVVWLTLLLIFCLLICFVTRILDIVMWDLCDNYEPLTSDALDRISQSLGCTEGSTDKLARVVIELEHVKTNFAEQACVAAQEALCRFFPCSASVTMLPCLAANVSFAEVMDEMDVWKVNPAMLPFDPFDTCEPPCSLEQCAATCRDSEIKNILDGFVTVRGIITIIELEVYPLAMCIPLFTLRDEIGAPFCTKMMPNIHNFFVLLMFVILIYIAMQIMSTLAPKRFEYAALHDTQEGTPVDTQHIAVKPAPTPPDGSFPDERVQPRPSAPPPTPPKVVPSPGSDGLAPVPRRPKKQPPPLPSPDGRRHTPTPPSGKAGGGSSGSLPQGEPSTPEGGKTQPTPPQHGIQPRTPPEGQDARGMREGPRGKRAPRKADAQGSTPPASPAEQQLRTPTPPQGLVRSPAGAALRSPTAPVSPPPPPKKTPPRAAARQHVRRRSVTPPPAGAARQPLQARGRTPPPRLRAPRLSDEFEGEA